MGEGLAANWASAGAQQWKREVAEAIGEGRERSRSRKIASKMCQAASQSSRIASKPVGNSLDEGLGFGNTRESAF